ncbi:hypothetical protein TcCL_ESM11308 [Trypanosoma cruzi]|nr:hypothetical protein TcCL_ESM11308 [Trypanosoma cruzi]
MFISRCHGSWRRAEGINQRPDQLRLAGARHNTMRFGDTRCRNACQKIDSKKRNKKYRLPILLTARLSSGGLWRLRAQAGTPMMRLSFRRLTFAYWRFPHVCCAKGILSRSFPFPYPVCARVLFN